MNHLHLPTGRISIEQFLAHLLLEQGIGPLPGVTWDEALGILRRGHEEYSSLGTDLALFP